MPIATYAFAPSPGSFAPKHFEASLAGMTTDQYQIIQYQFDVREARKMTETVIPLDRRKLDRSPHPPFHVFLVSKPLAE